MSNIFKNKYILKLQNFGEKLSKNKAISSMQAAMMSVLGIILVGSISQIISIIPTLFGLIEQGDTIYNFLIMPYNLTLGVISIWIAFIIGYQYGKLLNLNSIQSGIISLTCFLITCAPISTYMLKNGNTVTAMDSSYLGSTGMFVAIIISLVSIKISEFIIKKKLYIKMPDVVPPFLSESFKSLSPLLFNVIIWQIIASIIYIATKGSMNLPSLITVLLSVPISGLNSVPGMFVLAFGTCLLWCFGIHGTSVAYVVVMALMVQCVGANAEAVAAGKEAIFYPIFLYGMVPFCGGTGNTIGLALLGLKAKSEQIKAVAKVGIVPGFFGVNEPILFGMPIMYNPILCAPFILCPLIMMLIGYAGYALNILKPTYILVMSAMPMGVAEFMGTLNLANGLFPWIMILVSVAVYYPFFKIYDYRLYKQEQAKKGENN